MTDLDAIDIGGFREWFPLELEMDPDQFVETIVDHFADDPAGPDILRPMAIGVAGLVQQVKSLSDDQSLLLAAWALLPPGGNRLELLTVARLEAVRIRMGTTSDEMVEDLIQGSQLHQPVHVEQIETSSGPAWLVRIRTYSTTDHGTALEESICIFWLPEGENYAVVLVTLPISDLVVASDAAQALVGLAQSVKGL